LSPLTMLQSRECHHSYPSLPSSLQFLKCFRTDKMVDDCCLFVSYKCGSTLLDWTQCKPHTDTRSYRYPSQGLPYLEEPRNVIVHKGAEPLGISIVSGENGGIFVSKVTGGSIAHQAGLEYGDQLLEV
ncbi:hypothetical protein GOODEAATRI_012232, partial [Goodea atripinnis]